MYLWLDGEYEPARKKIESLGLSGVHIALTEKEWQDINKRFGIKSSIPYYLLFDKQGVMVNYGEYLRPSVPETKTTIEKLLEK